MAKIGDKRGRAKQYDPASILPDNAVLIQTYLRHRAGRLSEESRATYRGYLEAFAAALGPQRLGDVTLDDIATYFDAHQPRGVRGQAVWSLRTAHRHHSSLRRFYAWAVVEGHVPANPAARYELKQYRRERPNIIPRTDLDQLSAFIEQHYAVADPQTAALYALDAALVAFMNYFGMRVGAVSALEMARVKRERSGELVVWSTGKGGVDADFPIIGVVLDRYTRWMNIRRTVTPNPGHERFVFVHPVTRRRVSRQRANRRLREIAMLAGLDPEIIEQLTPHKFRHARARTMLDEGYDIRAVQSVLSHKDLRTTMIYIEDDAEARRSALRAQGRRRTT